MFQKTSYYELYGQMEKEQMLCGIQALKREIGHLEKDKETLFQKHALDQQRLSFLQNEGQEYLIIDGSRRGKCHKIIAE